jgi:hypothetical protein
MEKLTSRSSITYPRYVAVVVNFDPQASASIAPSTKEFDSMPVGSAVKTTILIAVTP